MVNEDDDHYSRQLADLKQRKLRLKLQARNAKVERRGRRKLDATSRDRNWRANIFFVLRSRYNEPDTKFGLHIGQLTNISVRSNPTLLQTYKTIGIPESLQTVLWKTLVTSSQTHEQRIETEIKTGAHLRVKGKRGVASREVNCACLASAPYHTAQPPLPLGDTPWLASYI
jgi:hypothetical protein